MENANKQRPYAVEYGAEVKECLDAAFKMQLSAYHSYCTKKGIAPSGLPDYGIPTTFDEAIRVIESVTNSAQSWFDLSSSLEEERDGAERTLKYVKELISDLQGRVSDIPMRVGAVSETELAELTQEIQVLHREYVELQFEGRALHGLSRCGSPAPMLPSNVTHALALRHSLKASIIRAKLYLENWKPTDSNEPIPDWLNIGPM